MAPPGSVEWHARCKVKSIRFRDVAQCGHCNLTPDDALELVKASKGKCSLCSCQLVLEYFKPHCLYQWSLDRLDRNLPHSKDNVRVTCLTCNVAGPRVRKSPCTNGCHPGDIPWGSAPCPSPEPEEIPFPVWELRRVLVQLVDVKRRRIEADEGVLLG